MSNPSVSKKPKVLFLATDCNPQWHSLPALIAEYFLALQPYADFTLVTHIRNQDNLEAWLPRDIHVEYMDTEKVAEPLYRMTQALTGDPNKAMTLQVALSYPGNVYFEYCVWKKFKHALKAGEYDIVHRASPMSPTIPSPIAKWSPVPFVIGPVLGGLPWPAQFKSEMRREGEWMNYFRSLHRFMPYYQSTYKHAAAILAGYKHTVGDIPKRDHERVIEFSEGAIHVKDYPIEEKPVNQKAKILFVGRMVPFKQPEVLIRCFEKSALLKQHELIVVGDGPELPRLQTLVDELGLNESVSLTGNLPYQRVRELMVEADIFAFPSVREQGGGVLTMASMARTPCVVVDYGGPSYRVPEGCGIKIPLGSVDEIISGFISALEDLVQNREKAQAFGEAAREFTSKFYSWEWKAKKTSEIYDWVLEGGEKPNYWEGELEV